MGFQYFIRKKKISGYPAFIKIEPTSICNLKCLGCRTGKSDFNLDRGIMSLDTFQKIIDELGNYLIEIGFYLWGDPLMNKELPKMISVASKRNIASVVSTNMHFLNKEMARKLLDTRLNRLIVGIDGTTQSEYEKIRPGGNLEKVMDNLIFLANEKEKRKIKYPLIEWQYIITDTNREQLALAKE